MSAAVAKAMVRASRLSVIFIFKKFALIPSVKSVKIEERGFRCNS
jgi:hypothetical protein